MKIKSEIKITHDIVLTDEESATLQRADAILADVVRLLGFANNHNDYRLMSPATGELIDISEIKRARGILSGIVDNRSWYGTDI